MPNRPEAAPNAKLLMRRTQSAKARLSKRKRSAVGRVPCQAAETPPNGPGLAAPDVFLSFLCQASPGVQQVLPRLRPRSSLKRPKATWDPREHRCCRLRLLLRIRSAVRPGALGTTRRAATVETLLRRQYRAFAHLPKPGSARLSVLALNFYFICVFAQELGAMQNLTQPREPSHH